MYTRVLREPSEGRLPNESLTVLECHTEFFKKRGLDVDWILSMPQITKRATSPKQAKTVLLLAAFEEAVSVCRLVSCTCLLFVNA